jgi:hypothetical protein
MQRDALIVSGWTGASHLREFRPDDDGRADFVLRLVERIGELGFRVVTDERRLTPGRSPAFELHIESQRVRSDAPKRFLLLIEDRHIRPQNFIVRWRQYHRVFSWDDNVVARHGAVKYHFPAHIECGPVGDFDRRDVFATMIAANKGQAVWTSGDLYHERVATLRWFQANAPVDLELYGAGWELPIHPPGLIAKGLFKLLKRSRLYSGRARACWKGIVPHKRNVLRRSKFNICYENTRGAPGYISEKIFDCFSTGCIPVYWGPDNIERYIPASCFVDRRRFGSTAELYMFLGSMSRETFTRYQEAMRAFCATASTVFGIDAFATLLSKEIVSALVQTGPAQPGAARGQPVVFRR